MIKGNISKMRSNLSEPIEYSLTLEEHVELNPLIGKDIQFRYTGIIHCVACGVVTKKSFGQGFCYKCFINAPEAAECIIRPELCRAHLGEGRDIEWEQKNHNQPHVVYLALTDTVKVGVTRKDQVPTRWIDQGAYQAIIFAETPNRYQAGVIEVALKSFFTDKTNWRNMLKNENDMSIDLVDEKWQIEAQLPTDITDYITDDETVFTLNYPVLTYPTKLISMSFDKDTTVEGKLLGIKGQYLLFDNDRVINLRKHSGYEVEFFF